MNFDITKIIPFSAFKSDINDLTNKINQSGELLVLENNATQFIVMSLDRYDYLSEIEQVLDNLKLNKENKNFYEEYHDLDEVEVEEKYLNKGSNDVKIGVLAKNGFRKLAKENKLSKEDLKSLCNEIYSKQKFNMNFAVLKKVNPDIAIETQKRDDRGYNRYYNFTLIINNEEYLLVSQWVENLHRKKLEEWFRAKGM